MLSACHFGYNYLFIDLILACPFFQASDDSSLQALEVLMNEFFDAGTSNDRKREIGNYLSGSVLHFPWCKHDLSSQKVNNPIGFSVCTGQFPP